MKLYFDRIEQPVSPTSVRKLFRKLMEETSINDLELYLMDTYNISCIHWTTFSGIAGLDIPDDQLTLLLLKYS